MGLPYLVAHEYDKHGSHACFQNQVSVSVSRKERVGEIYSESTNKHSVSRIKWYHVCD